MAVVAAASTEITSFIKLFKSNQFRSNAWIRIHLYKFNWILFVSNALSLSSSSFSIYLSVSPSLSKSISIFSIYLSVGLSQSQFKIEAFVIFLHKYGDKILDTFESFCSLSFIVLEFLHKQHYPVAKLSSPFNPNTLLWIIGLHF